MVKKLENLKWKPMWVSHLGCIKGCLDYLEIDISDAWLFGATGHAFIINIAKKEVCPSGPTAWHTEKMFELGKNIGYEIDGVFSHKQKPDFVPTRKKAWELVKKSIDKGIPCYGWELGVPEFYVVNGYDDVGYYYSGALADPTKMPLPWEKLADTKIGVIEMYSVKSGKPADDIFTIKQAFEFVLEHAKSPEKWIFPNYRAGLDGFDIWIKTLEQGDANEHGMAYNTEVWHECRYFAVEFLKQAKERLDKKFGPMLDEAITHYDLVARNLKRVEELYPFHTRKPGYTKDKVRIKKAVEALKAARNAEESGLKSLAKIVNAL